MKLKVTGKTEVLKVLKLNEEMEKGQEYKNSTLLLHHQPLYFEDLRVSLDKKYEVIKKAIQTKKYKPHSEFISHTEL